MWKRLSQFLLICGICILIKPLYFYTKGYLAQVLLDNAWNKTVKTQSPQLAWPWAKTYPVGKLYFPKLDESFTILDGTTTEALAFGPGHVEGTSYPGENGNICIAGHRDSFFNNIKDLSFGDIIRIDYVDSQQLFQVDSTIVVEPEELRWLEATGSTQLTLITCYPFYYVGEAPQRYIVRAGLVGP